MEGEIQKGRDRAMEAYREVGKEKKEEGRKVGNEGNSKEDEELKS